MPFTRAYDITQPANSDVVGLGATELRNFRADVQERMEIDHNFNQLGVDDTAKNSDGTHKKVTLATTTKPTAISDAGIIYVKDSADSKPELFFEDEDGDENQITRNGQLYVGIVGEICAFPLDTVPAGFLECNGASVSRTTYSELYAYLGTIYGTAGSTTFNLPDYRGRALRGWDHGHGDDSGAATRTKVSATGATMTAGDHVGTEQDHQATLNSHYHRIYSCSNYAYYYTAGLGYSSTQWTLGVNGVLNLTAVNRAYYQNDAGGNQVVENASSVATETRVRNTNILYCIRYTKGVV